MKQRKSMTIYLLAALLCIWPTGCMKEGHETVVMMSVGLQTVNEYWIKHGQPTNFNTADAVQSSTERYYVFTNVVNVGSQPHRCRFAVRSQLLHIPGVMAISDEGVLLWIRDKDGKVIVSPQKNGIE